MVDLSDEQVDFLAKFMGWNRQAINAMTWTGGAVEREAVMDRAEENYPFILSKKDNCGRGVCLSKTGLWTESIYGNGKSRFIALVNALMEAENG